MNCAEVSRISCIVDSRLSPVIDEVLSDMAIPEAFVQRAKQMTLSERSRALGFGSRVDLVEDRAEIFRFHVMPEFEARVARRMAEAADLYLPGRGFLFAEDVSVRSGEPPLPADPRLDDCAEPRHKPEQNAVLCCIVQRGMGAPLARAILDLGLCVPVVSFGEGMGLRNKLGLLRVTIPVDKEVIYFVVPERDADLLERLAVHKARLDRPGQGFIYRYTVRAYAVNLRVRRGKRGHAASMEQVIAALDEMRGSSEWRRLAPVKPAGPKPARDQRLACVSLVAEEGYVGDFVRAAMEAGAGGATLVPLGRRCYGDAAAGRKASGARETCDLIIPKDLADAVLDAIEAAGLFAEGMHGSAELSSVQRAVTYTG